MGRFVTWVGAAVIAAVLPGAANARKSAHGPRSSSFAPISRPIAKPSSPPTCRCRKVSRRCSGRCTKINAARSRSSAIAPPSWLPPTPPTTRPWTTRRRRRFFNEWQSIERDRSALRDKYVPRVRKVLPAQKAARYFQIENKMDAIVNLGLAADIPLVPAKK